MGYGCIPHWQRLCSRRGYRRMRPTSPATRTQSCTVHCNQACYGSVSGGREAPGVIDIQAVAGAGNPGLGGDIDGGSGGGTGGGEGGRGT